MIQYELCLIINYSFDSNKNYINYIINISSIINVAKNIFFKRVQSQRGPGTYQTTFVLLKLFFSNKYVFSIINYNNAYLNIERTLNCKKIKNNITST